MNNMPVLFRLLIALTLLMLNSACEKDVPEQTVVPDTITEAENEVQVSKAIAPSDSTEIEQVTDNNAQFNIGNTQYLFNLSDHTPEDLEALLQRAEEIRDTQADGYDELEIVMVLHGPDINIFRQENYAKHKALVDLAAKLDAFDIIDMKICETTMSNMGVERSEVPAFIESVPYAPDEIRRLGNEGYINL
ncbi:MAG: hypothetical protein GKR93_16110 [Gammaproteobacteria bacterium]|nr:hypothetical protein [Gammaproteobacteria bacterium]